MINWSDVKLSDKDSVNKLICASGCHGADYSFANIFIWRHTYNPKLAFVGNRMLVGNPDWKQYAYPKGDGDVQESIKLLLDEAHEHGQKLTLRGLTDKTLEEFLSIYKDNFEIIEDRDNADYIYTADKLCNLPGRHLSSKRNHINRFEKNGNWDFIKITSDNLNIAKSFIDDYYNQKNDADLYDESIAIREMFDNFDELGFIAGLLYQNNKPVAFSAGTALDNEVFDVHFEKAYPNVEGAYTMVNREFARLVTNELPDIGAFNREEDMGLMGLRKAKLSYHPDILLMKYFAKEK